MPGPTHFPSGLSTSPTGASMYLMPFLDPTLYHTWFSDFDLFTAADWIITFGTTSSTAAAVGGDGGLVALSVAVAKEDELVSAQWDGNSGAAVNETFRWETAKKMFLKARFKISAGAADAVDCNFGLLITDTSPLDASDGISFSMTDASATITAKVTKDSTSSTQALGTVVAATFHTVAIAYIPGTGFQCYFDEAAVGSPIAVTNAPDDEDLAVSINIQSGAVAITTMQFDYLLIAKER